MGRLSKLVVFLAVIGFIGIVGFAYVGDLSPDRQPVSQPVTLDVE